MEDLIQLIMPSVIAIVTTVIGYVAFRVGKVVDNAMEKYSIYDTLKANQVIVKASVEYVEQVFNAKDGAEKFEIAKNRALDIMNDKGISISEVELNALIEQAVFQFKHGLTEDGTNEKQ